MVEPNFLLFNHGSGIEPSAPVVRILVCVVNDPFELSEFRISFPNRIAHRARKVATLRESVNDLHDCPCQFVLSQELFEQWSAKQGVVEVLEFMEERRE